MTREGPSLTHLTARLLECPGDFLEDQVGAASVTDVAAVVSDLLWDLGGAELTAADSVALGIGTRRSNRDRNRRGLILLACWVFHDPWFRAENRHASAVRAFLRDGLDDLALLARAATFVSDADRREEFVRLCLTALDLHPAGESSRRAAERLAVLDSVGRDRRRTHSPTGEVTARPVLSSNDFE